MFTPSVLAAQERYYGRSAGVVGAQERDPLTDEESEFIAARDSFYLATVTETGWPYVQHRGGKPGFLGVLGPNTLAFADFGGNRQMLSTGNLAANDRVALFLMDYPQRYIGIFAGSLDLSLRRRSLEASTFVRIHRSARTIELTRFDISHR